MSRDNVNNIITILCIYYFKIVSILLQEAYMQCSLFLFLYLEYVLNFKDVIN